MLFDRIRKTSQPEPQDVDKLLSRLQSMRDRIGHRDVPPADMFGFAGPAEVNTRWPQPRLEQRNEPVRVRPEDVPPARNYVAWE